MKFTQEEQVYISSNKEELKNKLLKDFNSKMNDITSEGTLTPDQKLAKINAITSSLGNDFKTINQPNLEYDSLSKELSSYITRDIEFGYIRGANDIKLNPYFNYIRGRSSSDEEDSASLGKEKPRDPSIIIPDEKSLYSSEDQSYTSDVLYYGSETDDPEDEIDRQEEFRSNEDREEDRKEHNKTIEKLDGEIEEFLDLIVSFNEAQFDQSPENSHKSERTSSEEKQNEEEDINSVQKIESTKEWKGSRKPPMPTVPEDGDMSFDSLDKKQVTQDDEGSQLSNRDFRERGERVVLTEGSVYFPYQEVQPGYLKPAQAYPSSSEIIDGVGLADNYPTAPTESFVNNSNNNQGILGAQTFGESESSDEDSLWSVNSYGASSVLPTEPTNDNERFNYSNFFETNKEAIVYILDSEIKILSNKTNPNVVQYPVEKDLDLLGKLKDDLEALQNGRFDKISTETKNIISKKQVVAETVILTGEQKGKPAKLPKEEIKSSDKKKETVAGTAILTGEQKGIPAELPKEEKGPLRRFLESVRKKTKKSSKKNQSPVTPSAPPGSLNKDPYVRGENEETVVENGYRQLKEKPLPRTQQLSQNYKETNGLAISESFLRTAQPLQPSNQIFKSGEQTNNEIAIGSVGGIEPLLPPIKVDGSEPEKKKVGLLSKFLAPIVPGIKGKKKNTNGNGAREASEMKEKQKNKKNGLYVRKQP